MLQPSLCGEDACVLKVDRGSGGLLVQAACVRAATDLSVCGCSARRERERERAKVSGKL